MSGPSEQAASSGAHDLFDVSGGVIAVTGSSGQLGGAYVLELLRRGASVAGLDLAGPGAEMSTELAELDAEEGAEDRFLHIDTDVTDRASVKSALAAVTARFGAPTGLINNAGVDSPPGDTGAAVAAPEDYPVSAWDRVMEVNVKGTLLPTQVFGAAMAEAGRGSIINISSIYGVVSPDQRIYEYRAEEGAPFFKPVAYSASKSAVQNLTRYFATYWAPRGVRVNCMTLAGVWNHQDERFLAGYCAKVPLGRMANAHEYLGPAVFLLSEASSYMTGANMVIDGGYTAW